MSGDEKTVPDPKSGVAKAAVATTLGQPGGYVLTADDVPHLLTEGTPFDEVIALELTSVDRVEEVARSLVAAGQLPSERFRFLR